MVLQKIMSSGYLLSIQPTKLTFTFELNKPSACCLQITNKSDEYVAFELKSTNRKKYHASPFKGIVVPGATWDVTVTMKALEVIPPDMQCKDKFRLECVAAPKGATAKDITPEMFNKQSGKVVEEFIMGVKYVHVNPLVPEVSSAKASGVENGSQGTCLLDAVSNSLLMSMSSGGLLNIQPTALKFPFELNKQSSCCLQITNKSDEFVAFELKSTNRKKYHASPTRGIVLPRMTCDLTVTMEALKVAPKDMQCKDMFLIQSVTAPKGATRKDITREMFDVKNGKVVEKFEFGVIYVPTSPPVPECFDIITSDALQQRNLRHCGLRRRILHRNLNQDLHY